MTKHAALNASGQAERLQEAHWSKWTAVVLLFLPLLYVAIMKLWGALHLLFIHNDTSFPEGANVYAFITILQTGHLYQHPFKFPWNGEWYGPLYYLLGAVVARFCQSDIFITTVAFRSLSLISFIGATALLARMVYRLEKSRLLSGIVLMTGLGCIWAEGWTTSARPDLLSIFFFICALALTMPEPDSDRMALMAGVFGSFSFLCKQSTAPLFLVLLLCLVLEKKLRKAALTTAGALPASAIFLLVLWLRHDPIYDNYAALGHVTKDWSGLPFIVGSMFRMNQIVCIPLLLSVLGILVTLRLPRYRNLLAVTLAAWGVNLIALANVGAGTNYLILPYLLSLLFLPAAILWLGQRGRLLYTTAGLLSLLGLYLVIHQREIINRKPPSSFNAQPLHDLVMLSDNSYLEINSRKPQLLDAFAYHELAVKNYWQPAGITQTIEGRGYDLLLMTGKDSASGDAFQVSGYRGISLWGSEILLTAARNYRVLCEVGQGNGSEQHLILVPRDGPAKVSADEIVAVFGAPCYATIRSPQLAPGMH